jgi:hypothetical protein
MRMHINKVIVALGAKIARIAWVIMTKPGALYEQRGSAVAYGAGSKIARFAEDDETADRRSVSSGKKRAPARTII